MFSVIKILNIFQLKLKRVLKLKRKLKKKKQMVLKMTMKFNLLAKTILMKLKMMKAKLLVFNVNYASANLMIQMLKKCI